MARASFVILACCMLWFTTVNAQLGCDDGSYMSSAGDCEVCEDGGPVKTGVICENDAVAMTCTGDFLIEIYRTFYGRRSANVCPTSEDADFTCTSNLVKHAVRDMCDDEQSCSFSAINSDLGGDPCAGTEKYFRGVYHCALPETEITIDAVCERGTVTLDQCRCDQVIEVTEAFYGRLNRDTCPSSSILSTDCSSAGALDAIKALCDGQSTCSFTGDNGVSGDPCVGTHKYTVVTYNCITP